MMEMSEQEKWLAMAVKTVLNEIQNLRNILDLSELEENRLQGELAKVRNRLKAREYQIHSFSKNTHNVLERVRDVYAELEFYCRFGRSWQGLLSAIGLSNTQSIIDLCPGFTPKVELGLCYANFRGKAFLVNKDARSLSELVKFLKLFAPQFSYELLDVDIFEAPLPVCDVVAANHVLDDLVLDSYCTLHHLSADCFYEDESELKIAWQAILNEPSNYLDATIAGFCALALQITAPQGYLIVTQYQSYIERILKLREVTSFTRQLLEQCRQTLCKSGFCDYSDIAKNALPKDAPFSAAECLVLRRS
jgi:hypothetical protein